MVPKVARKSGQSGKAYNLLLEAEKYSREELFLERAKLGWDTINAARMTMYKLIHPVGEVIFSGSQNSRVKRCKHWFPEMAELGPTAAGGGDIDSAEGDRGQVPLVQEGLQQEDHHRTQGPGTLILEIIPTQIKIYHIYKCK